MKFPLYSATIVIVLTSLSACAGEEVVQSGNNIEVVETEGYADDIDNEFLQIGELENGNLTDENP